MRKGPYAPRVRARWNKTEFDRTEQQWPIWLDPTFSGLYVFAIGPLPVPVSLLPSDFTPGCWRYVPDTGSIRWEGDFDAISVFGRWIVEVKTDYDLKVQFRMGMKWLDASLNAGDVLTDWTVNPRTDFIGPATLAIDNSDNMAALTHDYALTVSCPGSAGLRYAAIEALGIDREDTRPVTWTAPVDPW